jgi:hypothetical protein
MEVASGGSVASGRVTFSGGGTLQLDDSVHFSGGLVAGFAQPDMLDLRDIAYVSGTTSGNWQQLTSGSTASGMLSVGNGTPATTANLTLLGQYAAGQFHITSDGAGGTFVTDPPVSAATDQNPIASVILHSS